MPQKIYKKITLADKIRNCLYKICDRYPNTRYFQKMLVSLINTLISQITVNLEKPKGIIFLKSSALRQLHCVNNVQIQSFFWSVFSRIWTEYGPEKTLYLDTFRSVLKTNISFKLTQQSTIVQTLEYALRRCSLLISKLLIQ